MMVVVVCVRVNSPLFCVHYAARVPIRHQWNDHVSVYTLRDAYCSSDFL